MSLKKLLEKGHKKLIAPHNAKKTLVVLQAYYILLCDCV